MLPVPLARWQAKASKYFTPNLTRFAPVRALKSSFLSQIDIDNKPVPKEENLDVDREYVVCITFDDESTLLISVDRKLNKFVLGSIKFIQEYLGRLHWYLEEFAMTHHRSGLRMRTCINYALFWDLTFCFVFVLFFFYKSVLPNMTFV